MSDISSDTKKTWTRLFPRHTWWKTEAWHVPALSVVAALLLAMMLLIAMLIVDLFDYRGTISFSAEQAHEAGEIFGSSLNMVQPHEDAVLPTEIILQDRGLLGTLWRFRDRLWTRPFIAMYRHSPALRSNSSALITLLIAGALIGLLRGFVLARARLVSARVGTENANHMRMALHRQAMRLGPGDLLDTQVERAHQLFTNDTAIVRDRVTAFVYRIGLHPITLVVLGTVALLVSPRLFLQMIVPLLGCWLLVEWERGRFNHAHCLEEVESEHRLNLLAECLLKTRLIRGYSMEAYESSQFAQRLEQFSNSIFTARRRDVYSRWLCWGLVLVCVLILLMLAGMKILLPEGHPQSLRLSQITLIGLCFSFAYQPLAKLLGLKKILHDTALAADRVYRYLDQIPEVGQAVGAKFLDPVTKWITFENVSYSLPGNDRKKLLDQIELKLPAGGITVIAASDPLEARALLYLLPRFVEPQPGRVLFDGEDIAWVTLESLRAETLYVGGKYPFFTGSILENITCGDSSYSRADAMSAAKSVHAHQFIQHLPEGYDTILGEHGEHLDAGQSYRLGLARAVLRKPNLLILEEPTEHLSEEAKTMIDDAYDHICTDRSVIVIPSRMQTIRRSDRVLLLHLGKVVTVNSHENLLAGNELYRHWEYVKFNVFRDNK